MTRSDPKWYTPLMSCFYVILGAALVYLFFKFALPWFMPFLIALAVARLLEPLIALVSKKTKLRRQLLSALFVLSTYALLGGVTYFIISYLASEIIGFLHKIPDYIAIFPEILETFRQKFTELISFLPPTVLAFLSDLWDQLLGSITVSEEQLGTLLETLTSFAVSLPNIFAFFITLIVSTFLISADYTKITHFLVLQIPSKWRQRFYRTKEHLTNTLWKWIKALLILLAITFGELCVGLVVLGIDHAIFLAALISLVDMLPILGVGSVLIPWALFELFVGNGYRAIFLAVLYGIISLVRNILEPRIIGAELGLHPLVTLICVYVGYKTLGLWGMLLFPILAITLLKFQEWGYFRIFKLPKNKHQTDEPLGGNGSSSS